MTTSSPSIRWLVGKNTIAQIIGKTIGAGITFVITLLIAQKLGAEGYGDFTKITTYVAFFYLIADFGLNAVFLQEDTRATTQEQHTLWHTLIILRLILSLVLVFAALTLLPFLPSGVSRSYTPLVKLGILIFSPTIIFQALLTSANAMFQKKLRYDLSTIATSVGSFISLFLIFIVTRQNPTILSTISSLFIGTMVTAGLALFFAGNSPLSTSPLEIARMKKLFIRAVPLATTLLFNLVYFHIDSVILTLMRTTTEVGVYGLAYKFFEFPLVIPTFFMNSLYPLLLTSQKESGKKFVHLTKKAAGYLFVSSIFFVVIFWIGAPFLSFIKPEFAQSVAPLRILILGLPFFFLSSLTMWTLIAKKKQTVLALIYLLAMIVNLVLNVLFIPTFGYIAASWITTISEALVLAISGIILLQSGL